MLENEIALVTGASRGIGQAIAQGLGTQGATVIGTATSESGAQAITERFAAAGIKGKGMVLNVADQSSVDAAIKAIKNEFGAPTILVNNAGITRDNLLMRMQEKDFDDVLNANLKSVFNFTKAVMKPMIKQRYGRIINISSIVGVFFFGVFFIN